MSPGGGRGEERAEYTPPAGTESGVATIEPRPAQAPAAGVPRPTIPETAATGTPPVTEPAPAGDLWARVLRGPGVTAVLRAVLSNLRVKSADAASGRVVIAGDAKYAESARSRHGMIVDALRRELGRGVELIIEAEPSEAHVGGPEAPVAAESRAEGPVGEAASVPRPVPAGPPTVISEHPLIREAMELFNARIVDVQHRRPASPS